ncbi:hypothetical protein L9F63_017047, partial [Diploptera punctata]
QFLVENELLTSPDSFWSDASSVKTENLLYRDVPNTHSIEKQKELTREEEVVLLIDITSVNEKALKMKPPRLHRILDMSCRPWIYVPKNLIFSHIVSSLVFSN